MKYFLKLLVSLLLIGTTTWTSAQEITIKDFACEEDAIFCWTTIEAYKNGRLATKEEFKFDELVAHYDFYYKSELDTQVRKVLIYDAEETLYRTWFFYYDSFDRLEGEVILDGQQDTVYYTSYQYEDGSRNWSLKQEKEPFGYMKETERIYDRELLQTSIATYYEDDATNTYRTEYTYGGDGKLEKEHLFENGEWYNKQTYTYRVYSGLLKRVIYSNVKGDTESRHYEYDEENRIKKTQTSKEINQRTNYYFYDTEGDLSTLVEQQIMREAKPQEVSPYLEIDEEEPETLEIEIIEDGSIPFEPVEEGGTLYYKAEVEVIKEEGDTSCSDRIVETYENELIQTYEDYAFLDDRYAMMGMKMYVYDEKDKTQLKKVFDYMIGQGPLNAARDEDEATERILRYIEELFYNEKKQLTKSLTLNTEGDTVTVIDYRYKEGQLAYIKEVEFMFDTKSVVEQFFQEGLLVEKREYFMENPKEMMETTTYTRENNRLITEEVRNGRGEWYSRMTYSYLPNGEIDKIVKEFPPQTKKAAETIQHYYDDKGRLKEVLTHIDGVLKEEQHFIYDNEGALIQTVECSR